MTRLAHTVRGVLALAELALCLVTEAARGSAPVAGHVSAKTRNVGKGNMPPRRTPFAVVEC